MYLLANNIKSIDIYIISNYTLHLTINQKKPILKLAIGRLFLDTKVVETETDGTNHLCGDVHSSHRSHLPTL